MSISAARFYATKRQRGTRLLGPPQGTWTAGSSTRDNRGDQNHWRFVASTTPTLGGVVTNANNTTLITGSNTADEDILAYTWLTPRLDAASYSGLTFQLCLRATWKALFSLAGVFKVHVWLTNGNTLTLKQVLLDNYIDTTPWTADFYWRSLAAPQLLADFTASAGDRIVIEIGGRLQPNLTGSNAFWISPGTCNSSNVVQPDAVANDTNLLRAGWFEFSSALSVQDDDRAAAPANTTCATATVIGAFPYQATVDTTGATDAEVWWTFTAPTSGMIVVDTLGSAMGLIDLGLRRGSCGGLIFIQDVTRESWFGLGQAGWYINAVAGTTYFIRVREVNATGNTLAARGSGGDLRLRVVYQGAPQPGDLFIDCLHIAHFRPDGTLQNLLSDFYYQGFGPPTGNAIDYSGLPLRDQFDGSTNVAHRLYVGIFQGASSFVAILPLTLTHGRSEIDDMGPTVLGASKQNISSLMLTLGRKLVVGWFGDHYDVIGQLASSGTYEPSILDQTHGDTQPGAPWPVADSVPVAQDVGGSDFVEPTFDESTLFYTSSGTKVKRWSLTSAAQLADFATVPNAAGPRPGTRTPRLFPPGDGSGGMLVANGSEVVRLNAAGVVIQHYVPAETDLAQDLDKVEFADSDATEFWVSDQLSTTLWRFDVATGAQLSMFRTYLPAAQLCGFSVYFGYRAGISSLGALRVDKVTDPPGDPQAFSFTAGGGLVPTSFTLHDGESQDFGALTPGAGYSVAETPVAGWTTSYAVSNGSPIDNLLVVAGQTTVVTVTNTLAPPATFGQGCPTQLPITPGPLDPGCAIPFFP